jgi:hypothetical protein
MSWGEAPGPSNFPAAAPLLQASLRCLGHSGHSRSAGRRPASAGPLCVWPRVRPDLDSSDGKARAAGARVRGLWPRHRPARQLRLQGGGWPRGRVVPGLRAWRELGLAGGPGRSRPRSGYRPQRSVGLARPRVAVLLLRGSRRRRNRQLPLTTRFGEREALRGIVGLCLRCAVGWLLSQGRLTHSSPSPLFAAILARA